MKKLFLFLTAAILSLTVSAQDWAESTDQSYDKEHVIYATFDGLTVNDNYVVGAFIDGECRGVAELRRNDSGAPYEPPHFALRVKGSNSDAGKSITFKVKESASTPTATAEHCYTLTKTLVYEPGITTGEISNLYNLNFVKATSFSYNSTEVEVTVGATYNIEYTASPEGAQLPDGFDDCFNAIPNDNVVSISGKEITALGVGNATIINTSGIRADNELSINVVERAIPVESISIDGTKTTTIYVDDEIDLGSYYTVLPANATNKNVSITADNKNVNIIEDVNGGRWLLQGLQKGTSVVTITSVDNNEIKATITFTVKKHVSAIEANYDLSFNINVGDEINLADYYTITPDDADNKDVEAVIIRPEGNAELSGSGSAWKLKALKKGTATVQVTSIDNPNTFTDLSFNIQQLATSITVEPNSFEIAVGESIDARQFNVTILPADASQEYSISTNDINIIEIAGGENGASRATIIGKGIGTATVTVMATDGSDVTTTFTVKVSPSLESVEISATEIVMASQTKTVLTLTPKPEGALVKTVPTITVTAPNAIIENTKAWKYVEHELTKNASGAYEIELSAYAMGEGSLAVSWESFKAEIPLHVGFEYNLANGWDWMSVFTDNNSSKKQTMEEMLGNKLIEARTQDGLLYNDPKYGYYGEFTDFSQENKCYKVKGNAESKYMLYGDYLAATTIAMNKGWNWIPYNCEYDQTIALNGEEGDVILSLTDGMATYTDGAWKPADFKLKAGQGYMYYTINKAELTLPDPYACEQPTTIGTSLARSFEQKYWDYNPREYSSIMPMIAEIEGYNSNEYTVGAFVGDECRGEGRLVDGKWFITVAGESSETVSFRIYNKNTGSTVNVENTVKMAGIIGSAKAPVKMNAGSTTAINNTEMGISDNNAWYNLQGQKIDAPQKGIFIKNGRKVVIK